ncbi:hypothetical protein HDU76_009583, partial [Blyttiomyces sp. JEL0837]
MMPPIRDQREKKDGKSPDTNKTLCPPPRKVPPKGGKKKQVLAPAPPPPPPTAAIPDPPTDPEELKDWHRDREAGTFLFFLCLLFCHTYSLESYTAFGPCCPVSPFTGTANDNVHTPPPTTADYKLPPYPRFHQFSKVAYEDWLEGFTSKTFKEAVAADPKKFDKAHIDHANAFFAGKRAWANAIDKWQRELRFAREKHNMLKTLEAHHEQLYANDPARASYETMYHFEQWQRIRVQQDALE